MDSSFNVSSGAVSDRGLSDKRPENEDSYLEMGQCGLYAVADGVGGAQAGDVASQMAMEILAEAFTNRQEDADAENVMRAAIERANSAIFQMAHELPQLSSMATTVVALHLADDLATIGHVGDSRLYRVDNDGVLHRETDDHSMVAEEVRAGRMTEEQADNHPSRNIISRALGAEPAVEIDLKTMTVEPGTAFLICSDGVTRHVSDEEITGVLTFGGDPDEVCDYIKNLCYERGAEDNLTAVVVKVAGAAGKASAASAGNFSDSDETTIASARPSPGAGLLSDDDDELLEIETHHLPKPEMPLELPEEPDSDAKTIPMVPDEPPIESQPESEIITLSDLEPMEDAKTDTVSTWTDSTLFDQDEPKPNVLAKVASAAVWMVVGGAIVLALYQFVLAPKPVDTGGPQLTNMQSSNQPLTAFEDNRRLVDKSPAEALARFGADPRDAEDYFLVGRANMLLGQFPEARKAFTEARNRIAAGEVDKNNARTLETEIAIAMAVTNDSTVQSILKTGLDASKSTANSNSNINAVR